MTVNAEATDVVTLRRLQINGFNTGTYGVRILRAKQVNIEDCEIFGFTSTSSSTLSTRGKSAVG